MKLIEVTGIPGCGKTTIFPVVKDYLKNEGFNVFDAKDIIQRSENYPFNRGYVGKVIESLPKTLSTKIVRALTRHLEIKQKYALKYVANNPQIFSYVAGITNSRPISEHHKCLTLRFFLNLAASYQIACESLVGDSVLLVDEGFVHKVVTFFVSVQETTIDSLEVQRYLKKIPPVDTLIMVEADVSLCKKRIIARKLPRRLEGSTESEIEDYLLRSKIAIECAGKFLLQRGTRVLSLNNSDEKVCTNNIVSQLSRGFKDNAVRRNARPALT